MPEFFSETEEAYLDAIMPAKGTRPPSGPALTEVRRAHALWLAMDERVASKDWVPLAADIEAYLRDGSVPGRGVQSATALITAVTDQGKIIR